MKLVRTMSGTSKRISENTSDEYLPKIIAIYMMKRREAVIFLDLLLHFPMFSPRFYFLNLMIFQLP